MGGEGARAMFWARGSLPPRQLQDHAFEDNRSGTGQAQTAPYPHARGVPPTPVASARGAAPAPARQDEVPVAVTPVFHVPAVPVRVCIAVGIPVRIVVYGRRMEVDVVCCRCACLWVEKSPQGRGGVLQVRLPVGGEVRAELHRGCGVIWGNDAPRRRVMYVESECSKCGNENFAADCTAPVCRERSRASRSGGSPCGVRSGHAQSAGTSVQLRRVGVSAFEGSVVMCPGRTSPRPECGDQGQRPASEDVVGIRGNASLRSWAGESRPGSSDMLRQVQEGKASPVEPAALKTSRGCGRCHEGGVRTSPAGEMASYIGLPFAFRDLLTPELPQTLMHSRFPQPFTFHAISGSEWTCNINAADPYLQGTPKYPWTTRPRNGKDCAV
ncbi:hypothetical protein B0H13DRAFT_1853677 [Mycena leptocephala]|nr:hypothetical protein B0H13DRAFT_1853677 [Mycena leptocephala]